MRKPNQYRWLALLLLIAVISAPGALNAASGQTRHCFGGFRHHHRSL